MLYSDLVRIIDSSSALFNLAAMHNLRVNFWEINECMLVGRVHGAHGVVIYLVGLHRTDCSPHHVLAQSLILMHVASSGQL